MRPGGPLYTISKNKVLFQNLKSGVQTSGGSPPLKLNNPKSQYLAQDGSMIQKVAMAYGGQPMPLKKQYDPMQAKKHGMTVDDLKSGAAVCQR
jgi:hypothetical protein